MTRKVGCLGSIAVWLGAIALGTGASWLLGKSLGTGRLDFRSYTAAAGAVQALLITAFFVTGENIIEDLFKSVVFLVLGLALTFRVNSRAASAAFLLSLSLAVLANAINRKIWEHFK